MTQLPFSTRSGVKPAPKVVVVMPAYNAGRTLRLTYEELPKDTVSLVILVDDGSTDKTLEVARELGLEIFVHDRNDGYGANQKTCYTEALRAGADIVVMVHPDYQYDPTLVPQIIAPIVRGEADLVLGSRPARGSAGAWRGARRSSRGCHGGSSSPTASSPGWRTRPSACASPSTTPATVRSAGECWRR